ncbi:MAG: GH25 family lysozyme [Candidatus Saccharimonadales bacterium]
MILPDVSEFQAPSSGNAPNWAGIKVQSGGGAIIRVGYGNAHLDHMFVSNYTALKQNKFSFMGLYQYLRGDQDVTSQANAFCNWVGPKSALAPGSIPMLDLEEGSGNQLSRANQWFSIVDAHFGLDKLTLDRRSWLYSGNSFATTQGLAPIFNSARHTWVASYKSTNSGLLPYTLWQSTDGKIGANRFNWAGCGFCDTSITAAGYSLADLSAMAYQPGHVVVTPPPAAADTFPAPSGFQLAGKKVSIGVKWAPVLTKVNGSLPTGYTVECWQLNGILVSRQIVTGTSARFDLLTPGWSFNFLVWANGAPSGPPHSTITIKA